MAPLALCATKASSRRTSRGRPRHNNRPPIPARASHLQRSFFWPRGLPPLRPDSIHLNTRRSPRPLGARPRRKSPADAQNLRIIFEVFRRAARLEPRRPTEAVSRMSREITRGLSHTTFLNVPLLGSGSGSLILHGPGSRAAGGCSILIAPFLPNSYTAAGPTPRPRRPGPACRA